MNKLDRVYEEYFGNKGTEFEVKTKERIEWICQNAKRGSIIDIGCSQGITSILLGRNGNEILGIDIEEEAIAFAKEKLQLEEKSVQEHVKFAKADFLELDLKGEKFDTCICTEVLEHLFKVDEFIEKISTCLEEDGKFIVSVPFGINDYHDHKRTYYFGRLYQQLIKYFNITQVVYMHKWMGVICTGKAREGSIKIDLEVLLREEEEFYKIERKLVDDNKRVRKMYNEKKIKTQELSERLKDLNDRYNKMSNSIWGKIYLKILEIRNGSKM